MKRATISSIIALGVLLAFGIYGARSDPPAGKARQGALPEVGGLGTAPAPENEKSAAAPAPFSVPAQSSAVRCPEGWHGFDNPVSHYRICYPAGWGFSELTDPAPLTTIRSVTLGTLRLLSPRAFPWRVGDSVLDAVAERSAIAIELNVGPALASTDAANPRCTLQPRSVKGTRVDACEELHDIDGSRATNGPIRTLRIALPLLQIPEPTQPVAPGVSQIHVTVRSMRALSDQEESLIWQIVSSIDAY